MFCKNCGQENNVENLYCLSCGVMNYKMPQNFRAALEGRSFCAGCGVQLVRGSLYCPGCGEDISKITYETPKLELGSVKININKGKPVQWQGLSSFLSGVQESGFFMRSFVGAAAAVVGGLILAWLVGLSFDQLIKNIIDDFYIYTNFKVNPLALFFQAHGVPIFVRAGINTFGSEVSASLTIRIGLMMLMFIPFLALFFSAKVNTGSLDKDDLSGRIKQALGQGIVYGILFTVLSIFLRSFIQLPMELVADFFGVEVMDVLRYSDTAGIMNSGLPFTQTLLFGVFWGCLFSTAGAVHAPVQFSFGRITDYFHTAYGSGIRAAFQMFKYLIILSGFAILGGIMWLEVKESIFLELGAGPGIILSLLLFINGISFVMLLLNGAVFQAGYFMPWNSESFSFSLLTGLQTPYENLWSSWYLLLILLVPVMLGFAGGYESQKYSLDKSCPWKNALSFSLCYTLLFVAVALVSQITGHLDMSGAASLFGMMGGQVPEKAHFILGFPVLQSLLTVGAISFFTALMGSYLASYHGSS